MKFTQTDVINIMVEEHVERLEQRIIEHNAWADRIRTDAFRKKVAKQMMGQMETTDTLTIDGMRLEFDYRQEIFDRQECERLTHYALKDMNQVGYLIQFNEEQMHVLTKGGTADPDRGYGRAWNAIAVVYSRDELMKVLEKAATKHKESEDLLAYFKSTEILLEDLKFLKTSQRMKAKMLRGLMQKTEEGSEVLSTIKNIKLIG